MQSPPSTNIRFGFLLYQIIWNQTKFLWSLTGGTVITATRGWSFLLSCVCYLSTFLAWKTFALKLCELLLWSFFPSIQWIVRSSSRNTNNASVSVAWLQAFPASSLSFCMKKRARALVHADRTIKNWPTQSQPCMVLLQPSLAATMCMHPAGEPPSFTCPTLSVDIEHTCKHGETVVSV